MDLDPRGYEGDTDLDRMKSDQKLSEIRRMRYSASGILLIVIGLMFLIVPLLGERRGSVADKYNYPAPSESR
ncbi:MAG: hypothetical protein FD189_1790 [Elusimicrobia bacterium]|nr:MAG: hypothetical protein FD154_1933 [Elusimicrobiota bacterium]KAF0154606.1 MAG: hypothetical protein FD189_1790 [Elusimicrobiota bacterium]